MIGEKDSARKILEAYSRGAMTALEVRRRLGGQLTANCWSG